MRQLLRCGLVLLAVLLAAETALAGKGTISKKPPAPGVPGTIIITDNEGDTICSGLGSTAPVGCSPGDEIRYNESIGENEGDLVSFTYNNDPATGEVTATGVTKLADGTLITGPHNDKLDIGANEAVTVNGGTVDGKVTLTGGVFVVINGGTIDGKITSDANSTVIIDGNSTVDGKVESTRATGLVLRDSNILGKVTSTSDEFVTITNCNIDGKLEIANPGSCEESGNVVTGPNLGCPIF